MVIWICHCKKRFSLHGMTHGHETNNNNKLRVKGVSILSCRLTLKVFLLFLFLLYMKAKVIIIFFKADKYSWFVVMSFLE